MRHDLTYPTLFNTLERGIRFGRVTVVLLCRFAPFAITRSEAVRFVLELVFICECFKMGAVQGVNMKPESYSINAWNRLGGDRNTCLGSKNLCLENSVLYGGWDIREAFQRGFRCRLVARYSCRLFGWEQMSLSHRIWQYSNFWLVLEPVSVFFSTWD